MVTLMSFGRNFATREGVSAEVGAPHEVTSIEKNMLAKMGATVMGKTDKFETTSWEHTGKGSVAEVLTGVHTGLEVQVLAFVSSRWGKPTPAKFKVCPQVIILPFF